MIPANPALAGVVERAGVLWKLLLQRPLLNSDTCKVPLNCLLTLEILNDWVELLSIFVSATKDIHLRPIHTPETGHSVHST